MLAMVLPARPQIYPLYARISSCGIDDSHIIFNNLGHFNQKTTSSERLSARKSNSYSRCLARKYITAFYTNNLACLIGLRIANLPSGGNMKRKRSVKPKRVGNRAPRSAEEFFAMPESDQDFWNDVGQIATEVRNGGSLSKVARKYHRNPRQVLRAAPAAFRKLKNGRYAAKTSDRILRVLVMPTRKGLREIGVRDSRQAS